jgi:hypothetical protein
LIISYPIFDELIVIFYLREFVLILAMCFAQVYRHGNKALLSIDNFSIDCKEVVGTFMVVNLGLQLGLLLKSVNKVLGKLNCFTKSCHQLGSYVAACVPFSRSKRKTPLTFASA